MGRPRRHFLRFCDAYEARLAELLDLFAARERSAGTRSHEKSSGSKSRTRVTPFHLVHKLLGLSACTIVSKWRALCMKKALFGKRLVAE